MSPRMVINVSLLLILASPILRAERHTLLFCVCIDSKSQACCKARPYAWLIGSLLNLILVPGCIAPPFSQPLPQR